MVAAWGSGRRIGLGRTAEPFADLLVEDGDVLPIAGREVRALWTPGHTAGHLCLVDEGDGLLFTGDHVLPRINPGIGLGGRTATNPLGTTWPPSRGSTGTRTSRSARGTSTASGTS